MGRESLAGEGPSPLAFFFSLPGQIKERFHQETTPEPQSTGTGQQAGRAGAGVLGTNLQEQREVIETTRDMGFAGLQAGVYQGLGSSDIAVTSDHDHNYR